MIEKGSSRRRPRRARDWKGRRVTVMGLGRHGGGVSAVRYLAEQGAKVTVSDFAPAGALAESLEALRGLPIHALKLGGHDEADFRDAECVAINPAVRSAHPCLRIARASGAVITSEVELFLERSPARTIGVTGSNGKSTTATLLAGMLGAAGRRTWLGGNIGRSLLGELDRITREDWVVLELSSFQLAHLSDAAPLPQIAVITNCTPNHLDWHGDFAAYVAAKRRLLGQTSTGSAGKSDKPLAILNARDPLVRGWSDSAVFSWPLSDVPALPVPGNHNRHNAACAAAAAEAAGVSRSIICKSLEAFRGLAHRLQFVGEVGGRRFFNDSKATSPHATMAALASLDEPLWLLAGGDAKGASFDDLAEAIVGQARGAGLFGAAREAVRASIATKRAGFAARAHETLDEAFDWCWRQSRPGDAILLSPACASFDQFRDFGARGSAFCELVRRLESRDHHLLRAG